MSKKAAKGSRRSEQAGSLPIYRAAWKGQLLLACRKCRKKLKRSGSPCEAAKLKKLLEEYGRQDEGDFRLRIIDVPCLKLCPKGGITVCTQQQLGRGECSIVRTRLDVGALFAQAKTGVSTEERNTGK